MNIWRRLFALLRSRRLDADLDAEIAAHLELAEKEARDSGLSAREARRVARLKFGAVPQVRESHRDRRSLRPLENFVRDLRFGLGALARDPGFALVAIGVLAIGIGANAAMFSIVDAALLRPLPFPEPERIVRVWEAPDPTDPESVNGLNTLDLLDWMRLNTVFEAFSAERGARLALTGEGEPVQLEVELVSPDYFEVFGVQALRGRTFAAGEDEAGASAVVVLSHATWQSRFGADPEIVGREIDLNQQAHTVVGVLPPGPFDRASAALWKPLVYTPDRMNRGFHWLGSVARLKPGVTVAQAQEELAAIDASLTDLSPDWKKDWGVRVEPYDRRLLDDDFRRSVEVTFGAVAFVLLIACANVANLLLGKGAARRKEMAVRTALGAGRGRLVSQLLTETAALCVMGGLAGVLLARLLIAAASPFLAESLPYTAEIALDWRVLAFSAATALGVALLVGLLPSLRTSLGGLAEAMNQSGRGSSGTYTGKDSLRRAIVVAEVAVSLVLLCGSLLLLKSLDRLQQVDEGVRVENVMTATLDLPQSAYPTPDSARSFYRSVVERLRAVPGVSHAALTTDLPLKGVDQGEGMGVPGIDAAMGVRYKRIDANYLRTLEVSLVSGRGIEERDVAASPRVALLNEQAAAELKRQFDLDEVVGRTVWISTPNYENSDGDGAEYEVVGVLRSERTSPLSEAQDEVAYVALDQVPDMDVRLVIRALGDPAAVVPGIRDAVGQVDPLLPVGGLRTLKQIRDSGLAGAEQPTWVIGAFALVATLLAALGLYGAISFSVNQRRREIGIRMALGARSSEVLSRVLKGALSLVAVGVALGLLGALALGRVVESMLFEVSTADPAAIAAAAAAMLLVGCLAGFLPARRAARLQPTAVLREEG